MFSYNLRLALLSFRRNPGLTALMIGAIGLGIAVCTVTLAVYRTVSANPIWWKNDVLYAVTIDSWDPKQPASEKHQDMPPPQLTMRDARAAFASDIPLRKVMMYKASGVLDPERPGVTPFRGRIRATNRDFFAMFDVPFRYGNAWSDAADQGPEPAIVLSRESNAKLFGGENSIGRSVQFSGREFRVVGVLDAWDPAPSYYDLNNGSFEPSEDAFIPIAWSEPLELYSVGNTNCWKSEDVNSFKDLMNSECVWIQFWAEFASAADHDRFQSWLDGYVNDQKKTGRLPRPLNNRLLNVDDWLKFNDVVGSDQRVLVGLAFMFLAVCLVNTVGLLLAKFLSAAPLTGLRRALGASRGVVFQQHLVEVAAIGIAGGVVGVLLAALGLLGLRAMYASPNTSFALQLQLDPKMVAIAFGLSILAGLATGLYPAWRIGRVEPARYLKTQ